MEVIHTLHDFMMHTKNIVYILMVMILVAMPLFWKFLNDTDEE